MAARSGEEGVEDDGGAVDHGVLVIAVGRAPPLLDVAVATLDHVPVLVVGDVQPDRSSAA